IMSLKATFDFYNILAGILINLVCIFVVIRSLNFIERMIGKAGLMVVRKFFGVILLAIAIRIFKSNLAIS
ncbi:MAG: MarC family protein, partial [Chitinophagaceae bacterium]